jgi:hypothetical protein
MNYHISAAAAKIARRQASAITRFLIFDEEGFTQ